VPNYLLQHNIEKGTSKLFEPNHPLQQTGHANEALSSFNVFRRVSRLLSEASGGAVPDL
jgi:hypothetical protein